MAAKYFLFICASALLVQATVAYPGCGCGVYNSGNALLGAEIAAAEIVGAGIAANNFGYGYAAPSFTSNIYSGPAIASSSGGALRVSSFSPIAPSGINIVSENSIDGLLEVVGSLPVLAAVAFEGAVPSAGSAGTSYSCGSGNVGISSESLAAAGIGAGRAAGNQLARSLGAGYGAGLSGLNAGRVGLNAGLAGARLAGPSCGCSAY